MSNESDRKLTINDPVDPDTLKRLADVHDARQQLALQLLEWEEEKVRLLVAARPLREERTKLFEKILIDRGLPPSFQVDIDLTTGKLHPHGPLPKPKVES